MINEIKNYCNEFYNAAKTAFIKDFAGSFVLWYI